MTAIRVSVIVPVYEQWELAPKLLACLERQTFPRERFEIILVDNGSTNFITPALPQNARLIHCERPGSYAARNAAVELARGDWLAFTDSDCLPEPTWLDALMTGAAATTGPTILAGAVEMKAAGPTPNAYEIYDIIKGIPQERYAAHGYGATANLAVSSRLFRDLGGFDAKRMSGGDADFCRRAVAMGAQVAFVAEARTGHSARSSWKEIVTKARRLVGGQIGSGSSGRRAYWVVRTLAPPAVEIWRFATNTDRPFSYRLIAIVIQLRLWGVEIGEVSRLALGGRPERR